MNFVYNHWVIPAHVSRRVVDELRAKRFTPMHPFIAEAPSVWTPERLPTFLTPLWEYILDAQPNIDPLLGVSAFHYQGTYRMEPTVFPAHFGDVVAVVVLGAHARMTFPGMDTTICVHNRSVLVMHNASRVQHAIAAVEKEGLERYVLVFYRGDTQ